MGIATSQIYLMQKFNKEIMLPKLLKRKQGKFFRRVQKSGLKTRGVSK